MTIYSAMALLFALQLKHLVADFYSQPSRWFANKHRYISIGGWCHALAHGLLSFVVLYGFTRNATFSLMLSIVELIVHFHIDWIKASVSKAKGWKNDQHIYWVAFGSDQALHQLSYIIMVLAVNHYL